VALTDPYAIGQSGPLRDGEGCVPVCAGVGGEGEERGEAGRHKSGKDSREAGGAGIEESEGDGGASEAGAEAGAEAGIEAVKAGVEEVDGLGMGHVVRSALGVHQGGRNSMVND